VLTARQVGRLSLATGRVRVDSGTVLDAYLGWREGRLRADARPLGDVADELSRWYGVHFEIDARLRQSTVSADLRLGDGQSLDRVVHALAASLNASATRTASMITLVPQRPTR